MIRRGARGLFVVVGVLASPLAAAPYDSGRSGPSATLMRALSDELERSVKELRLPGLAAPYFVAYTVLEGQRLEIDAEFGGIEEPREGATRLVQVELRVGSREFDDSHFVSAQGAYRQPTTILPSEDDYDALRNELWSITDRAYKDALERMARKTVYRDSNHIREVLPDLSEEPVASSRETSEAGPPDRRAWERVLRRVSAVFRRFPDVRTSSLDFAWRAQHLYYVDSEGRSYVKPAHWIELSMRAETQAEDGMKQVDDRQMLWTAPDAVPKAETLEAAAERLAQDVVALARAPKLESYVGPVLLEGPAAGEFFAQLLANGLAHPRELWVEQEWNERLYRPGALTGRLGLRVISPLFDVVDDPTLAEFEGEPLLGHYGVDEEGIPPRRVELVEHGILRDLLMSRAPVKERPQSNGHGRGGFYAPAAAVIGNLFVRPETTMPLADLKQRLRDEARAFGLDHGLLVRRLVEERRRGQDELLGAPVLVYAVDVATGTETLLRDARFQGVTLRALRDIVAASDSLQVYNLGKSGPFRGSAATAASIVHPSVLLSEMELVKSDEKPSRAPYLPHPHFAPGKR